MSWKHKTKTGTIRYNRRKKSIWGPKAVGRLVMKAAENTKDADYVSWRFIQKAALLMMRQTRPPAAEIPKNEFEKFLKKFDKFVEAVEVFEEVPVAGDFLTIVRELYKIAREM